MGAHFSCAPFLVCLFGGRARPSSPGTLSAGPSGYHTGDILFVVGIYLLVKSADLIVDSSSSIAKRFGVSSLIIGLTVVAFGTSLPELVVSVVAVRKGNVDLAVDGLCGLESIARKEFDVVLMDVQMPVMNGHTATEVIRSCELGEPVQEPLAEELLTELTKRLKGRRLLIVAMTANAMCGDKEICLEAGMDDYLTKPFQTEQLENVLRRVVNNRKHGVC